MKKITLILLAASALMAESDWKVTGKVEAGAGYISTQSSESTSDEETITTLNREAETSTSVIPVIGYAINADTPDKRYRLFLRDKQYLGIETGITYKEGSDSFTLSLNRPLFEEEVWKNPYDTTNAREETGVDKLGAAVKYHNSMGKGRFIDLSYAVTQSDVSEDDLLQISEDLARDSLLHEGSMNIGTGAFSIGFSYAYNDADGGVYTYDEPGVNIGVGGMLAQKWFGLLNAAYSQRYYHKENPYFNEKQEDSIYSVRGMVRYFEPFDLKRSYAFGKAIYSQTQSNIMFFDQEMYAASLGMGYNFSLSD